MVCMLLLCTCHWRMFWINVGTCDHCEQHHSITMKSWTMEVGEVPLRASGQMCEHACFDLLRMWVKLLPWPPGIVNCNLEHTLGQTLSSQMACVRYLCHGNKRGSRAVTCTGQFRDIVHGMIVTMWFCLVGEYFHSREAKKILHLLLLVSCKLSHVFWLNRHIYSEDIICKASATLIVMGHFTELLTSCL